MNPIIGLTVIAEWTESNGLGTTKVRIEGQVVGVTTSWGLTGPVGATTPDIELILSGWGEVPVDYCRLKLPWYKRLVEWIGLAEYSDALVNLRSWGYTC